MPFKQKKQEQQQQQQQQPQQQKRQQQQQNQTPPQAPTINTQTTPSNDSPASSNSEKASSKRRFWPSSTSSNPIITTTTTTSTNSPIECSVSHGDLEAGLTRTRPSCSSATSAYGLTGDDPNRRRRWGRRVWVLVFVAVAAVLAIIAVAVVLGRYEDTAGRSFGLGDSIEKLDKSGSIE